MKEFIQAKDHLDVRTVVKALLPLVIWKNMKEFIQEKNLMVAGIVKNPLQILVTWVGIKEKKTIFDIMKTVIDSSWRIYVVKYSSMNKYDRLLIFQIMNLDHVLND